MINNNIQLNCKYRKESKQLNCKGTKRGDASC